VNHMSAAPPGSVGRDANADKRLALRAFYFH